MDLIVSLERDALKFCQQALRPSPRGSAGPCRKKVTAALHRQVGPGSGVVRLQWLLPDLARLIARHHDRPARDFVLTVRRFVDEHTFIEDAGDPVFDQAMSDEAQALVDASLRVHRAVHHRAASREDWHDVPVPPLMCG